MFSEADDDVIVRLADEEGRERGSDGEGEEFVEKDDEFGSKERRIWVSRVIRGKSLLGGAVFESGVWR